MYRNDLVTGDGETAGSKAIKTKAKASLTSGARTEVNVNWRINGANGNPNVEMSLTYLPDQKVADMASVTELVDSYADTKMSLAEVGDHFLAKFTDAVEPETAECRLFANYDNGRTGSSVVLSWRSLSNRMSNCAAASVCSANESDPLGQDGDSQQYKGTLANSELSEPETSDPSRKLREALRKARVFDGSKLVKVVKSTDTSDGESLHGWSTLGIPGETSDVAAEARLSGPFKDDVYRDWLGNLCKVEKLVTYQPSGEQFVVYLDVNGKPWCCKLSRFKESVDDDGCPVPRFARVNATGVSSKFDVSVLMGMAHLPAAQLKPSNEAA